MLVTSAYKKKNDKFEYNFLDKLSEKTFLEISKKICCGKIDVRYSLKVLNYILILG